MIYVPLHHVTPGREDIAIVRALVAIVGSSCDPMRWDRRWSIGRWVRAERIRDLLRLDRPAFNEAASRAEAAGLVAVGETTRGFPAIALRRPALAIMGAFSGPRYRPVDRERLAGVGAHAALVAEVAARVSATPLVEWLAIEMNRDLDDLWGEIRGAEAAGLLHSWPDHPAGPSVTLTAIVARKLGLRLSDDGSMWLVGGQPDPTTAIDPIEVAGASVGRDADLSDPEMRSGVLDSAADPDALDPLVHAEAIEGAESLIARGIAESLAAVRNGAIPAGNDWPEAPAAWGPIDNPSKPDHARHLARSRMRLVGLQRPWPVPAWIERPHGSAPGERPWLVPWTPEDGPCPACSGRDLGILDCCLVCDRGGWERLAEELAGVVAPAPIGIATADERDANGFTAAEVADMPRSTRRAWGYPDPRPSRAATSKRAAAARDRTTLPKAMAKARRRAKLDATREGLKGGLGA